MAWDIGRWQELVDVYGQCQVVSAERVLKSADVGQREIHTFARNTALSKQSACLFEANRRHIAGSDVHPGSSEKRCIAPLAAAEIERGSGVRVAAEGSKEAQSRMGNLARFGAEEVTVRARINTVPLSWKLKCHSRVFTRAGTIPFVDLDTALFLLSPAGRTLLTEADTLRRDRAEMLTALTRLRRSASPEVADAAWEMANLRKRGETKFGPAASEMYFLREALEQASGRGTADYHAQRLKAAGAESVSDLGGGIGGDTLAFARAGLRVFLYERDPARAAFAAENVRVCEQSNQVEVSQTDFIEVKLDTDAAWLDPARRSGRRRVSDPEEYLPPLSWLHTLLASGVKSIGVKLAPAIDHALASPFEAELEFISDGGECREALLWLGEARSGHRLSATLITPSGTHTLSGVADERGDWTAPTGSHYLYEPDPAVIRAHLVGTLAEQTGTAAVDPQIAYLLGDTHVPTPFADAYEVFDQFPYSKKRLQDALTARNIGRVIIKKRGFPLEPDAVRKMLKLRGTEELIVVLARTGTGHTTFLCRHLPNESSQSGILN